MLGRALFHKNTNNRKTIQEEFMSKVKRVYVEKKQPFAVTAKELTDMTLKTSQMKLTTEH